MGSVRPAWRVRQALRERQGRLVSRLRVHQSQLVRQASEQQARRAWQPEQRVSLPMRRPAFRQQEPRASRRARTRVAFQPHSSRRRTLQEGRLSPPPVYFLPAAVADLVF